jgi:membrane protein DedA with SNARE-associated domain
MSIILLLANAVIWFIETFGLLGIMITMALESALVPLPSEVIMPFAGYVAWSRNSWLFFWQSIIVATFGNLIGSVALYYIGIFGGRPLIIKYGKYLLVREDELRRAELWFQKKGDIVVLIGRMMPAVRTVISLPAGIFRMSISRFIIFTVIGSIPWNIMLAYIGYILGLHWMMILNYSVYIDIIGILALFVLLLFIFIRTKR